MTYFYCVAAALLLAVVVTAAGAPMRVVEIVDPIFKAKAYSYTIPEGWEFEGAMLAGSSCLETPYPVFRMTAPDGITEMKMLPRLDYTWSERPKPPTLRDQDCLVLDKEVTAADFLKIAAAMLGVTIVREDPSPNHAELQEKMRLQKSGPRMDNARVVVRYVVNGIPVEEDLTVKTLYMDSTGYTSQGSYPFKSCCAWISRARAREGQLLDLRNTFAGIERSVVIDPEGNKKWMSAMHEHGTPVSAAHEKIQKEAQTVRQKVYADVLAARQSKPGAPHSGDWADFVLAAARGRK
jgi:hypothetical protein